MASLISNVASDTMYDVIWRFTDFPDVEDIAAMRDFHVNSISLRNIKLQNGVYLHENLKSKFGVSWIGKFTL